MELNICWDEQPSTKMSWDLWLEDDAWGLYYLEQGRFQFTLIPVSLSLVSVWWLMQNGSSSAKGRQFT